MQRAPLSRSLQLSYAALILQGLYFLSFLFFLLRDILLFLLMSQWDERRAGIAASCSATAPSGSCANRQLVLLLQRYSQIFALKDLFSPSLSPSSLHPEKSDSRAPRPARAIQHPDLASNVSSALSFDARCCCSDLIPEVTCSPIPPAGGATENSIGGPEDGRKIPGCH